MRMVLHKDIPRIALQVSRGIVVASIQVDLDDDVLAQFREDLLGRIQTTGACGVILDVSGLEILDSEEFAALRRIISMTDLMGARSVIVGLRPGVVSSLIETGADVDGLDAAVSLDVAFTLLEPAPEFESELESEPSFPDEPEPDTDRDEQTPPEDFALPTPEAEP